ncbi:hypothetical protein GON26_18470 [Flavobacterium sp. GA093]|uniref:Lipoprotein n=1 Tax=Flavobacterium hydrocarbonoxydans TaxID=2683249 RepID=A0A6I4NTG1_9FLAO|nr:hypothetical protein [Flavobacterium hydrocarbonoxydans]MWB96352.1 hypothetical protein [Flavobacterium hydrocarbonoxydans]
MKNICFLVIILFLASCEQKKEGFKPTEKLDLILKNDKLNKAYSDFRMEDVYLSSDLENQDNFIKFINETNTNDLLSLTECEIPIVRCFAFKALVEKDYPYIRQVLFKHKNDNEFIEYGAGQCIRMKRTVSSYMMLQLDPYSKSKNKFTKIEYNKIQKEFWEK